LFLPSLILANRSTKGVSRLSSSERANITLPDEIKEILIGIMLGDALVHIVRVLSLFIFFSFFFLLDNIMIEYNIALNLYYFTFTLIPILIYTDPKEDKASILTKNKGKSGIYLWKNKVNGKKYVGSSVDLSKRLRNYLNISYLSDLKDIMLIYKALLTHGFDNFTLEILEYCNPSDLINREQHYIDLLKPEYNILKIAGSSPTATELNIVMKLKVK